MTCQLLSPFFTTVWTPVVLAIINIILDTLKMFMMMMTLMMIMMTMTMTVMTGGDD